MSMIQVQEARDQILSKIKVKGVEKVSLDQALGRVLAVSYTHLTLPTILHV